MNRAFFSPPIPWSLLLLLLVLPACGGGGGGGGGGGRFLSLDSALTPEGVPISREPLFLNQTIELLFTEPVDPATVNEDSVRVREARTGSRAAVGDLAVVGSRILFQPKLPLEPDLSDTGLQPDQRYEIFLPGSDEFDSVRSIDGGRLAEPVTVEFRTRSNTPLFLDLVEGPPRVLAVVVDLDQDGVFEADGDPTTPEPEEFVDFDAVPAGVDLPVGLARNPLRFGYLLSEPVLPASVFSDLDLDSRPDDVKLLDVTRQVELSPTVELEQRLIAADGRLEVLITVAPETTLPPASRLRLELTDGIEDYAGLELDAPVVAAEFETRDGPQSFSDALVEDFDDQRNLDPSSSAEWDTANSNVLTAGLGFSTLGGNGQDGSFFVPDGETVTLNTNQQGGIFQFTEFFLPATSTLEFVGARPARLRCLGDMFVEGTITVNGREGRAGGTDPARKVLGGRPGPGGFEGGGANSPPWGGPSGSGGRIPWSSAQAGDSPPGAGGGQPGRRDPLVAGGGGGGGHARVGATCFAVSINCGFGGGGFGTPEIAVLLGGSGGGGGGNRGFFSQGSGDRDVTGGGGGGGGGALSIECGGVFSLTGIITAEGGVGGLGGPGTSVGDPGGAGGGGGAGGAIRIKALEIAPIDTPGSRITAQGGVGGMGGGFGATFGGSGADGRIFIESFDFNGDGLPNDFIVDRDRVQVAPLEVQGVFSSDGTSFALSRFRDTGAMTPRYSFDGNDPVTGEVTLENRPQDIRFRGEIPLTAKVFLFFQGTNEDPLRPYHPDPERMSPWTPRIEDLDGYRFIRYRMEFSIGEDIGSARPVVEELTIRFDFDI